MKKIKKGGFVYEVAYGLADKYDIPCKVDLCRLFWRFMFMFFIGWPSFGILAGFFIILGYVGGFPFARKFNWFKGMNLTVPYEKWPKIKRHRIFPVWALSLLPVAIYSQEFLGILSNKYFLWLCAIITGIVIIIWGWNKRKKSEIYCMFQSYISAKKQKICPIIEIE